MRRLQIGHRLALWLAVAGITLAAGLVFWLQAEPRADVLAGHALFKGRPPPGAAPVDARLVGHTLPLPALAWRCSNCHDEAQRTAIAPEPGVSGQRSGERFARALDGTSLTQWRARRGGPPSRYTETALCALLRTGIDPAQVMIDTTMPRYQLSDAQCGQLWKYLQTR